MASKTCWRCLTRLALSDTLPPIHLAGHSTPNLLARPATVTATGTASFSTTSAALKTNLLKKQTPIQLRAQTHARRGPALRLKKKKPQDNKRRPEPGERKAIRKRIVLSNTNAFTVIDIPVLSKDVWQDPQLGAGSLYSIPGDVIDRLRAIEAFKPSQSWKYFERPCVLLRKELGEIMQAMDSIDRGQSSTSSSNPPSSDLTSRIITGSRGSGKSVLLLQAQALAFLRGWIVIHIPEAQELTIAHTAYAPAPRTNPTKYTQLDYTASLLGRIHVANQQVLSQHRVTHTHDRALALPPDATLDKLVQAGIADHAQSWAAFNALWKELTAPAGNTSARPPVLLTLDGLAHVSRLSSYLAADMRNIHAHDLVLVEHFVSQLCGAGDMRGVVLAADSASNRPSAPTLDLAVAQSVARTAYNSADGKTGSGLELDGKPGSGRELSHKQDPMAVIRPAAGMSGSAAQAKKGDAAKQGLQPPMYDPLRPYVAVDERVLGTMRNVDVLRVGGLDRDETRRLLEYFARSGMLRRSVTNDFVHEIWATSGEGLVGEMERGTVASPLL